jgi:cysteine desulfurase
MRRVYLDHNATSPVHPEVRDAMLPFLGEHFGNPSSSHWAGRDVAGHVRRAREQVAELLHTHPSEIVFTGSGSEGDNLALKGVLMRKGAGAHVVTAETEHPAVFSTCKALEKQGFAVTYVGVGRDGTVDPDDVKRAIRKDTAIISIMYANNETGVINPVREIAAIAMEHGVVFHTDAVQAVGKIPLDVHELGVDLLTASGHKYNAPKGVGFQYVRKGIELLPLISGGHQEHGVRAGTENVAGIVALGTASEIAARDMPEKVRTLGALRDKLEEGILSEVPEAAVNGHRKNRMYNTANVSIPFVEGDALMSLLDREGIAVSTGSACASGEPEPSHVLTAMGIEPLVSRGALRLSLGLGNTEEDVDYCLTVLVPLARKLQKMSPFYTG